ncbi:MAG: prolyl oligopeptidase family serine peptidase [Gemmatimonadota bacterium]|nr:prolyl oligopeptidase family serine peptidase [Gemmatimonadota bacterium]
MPDRPSSDADERFLDISPNAHAPTDARVAGRLRHVLKRIIRPRLPERDPRTPGRKIRGPGPVHRVLFLALAGSLAGCGGADAPSAEFASAEIEVGEPPPTRTDEVVDVLHGVEVADHYRWLEDQQAPETREWIEAQNAYTDAIFEQIPGRERLTSLVSDLLRVDQQSTPVEKGGRYFYMRKGAEDDLWVLYVREGLGGEERVLIDPHDMSEDHTTSVSWADISEDGTLMVYRVREGGVDETALRVLDVDAGEELSDEFPPARYGSVTLTPDAGGLYYSRFGSDEPRILYHRMGTDPSDDVEVFGEGYTATDIPSVQLSDDGRWMLFTVSHGSSGPTGIHLARVGDDGRPGELVEVIDDGVSETSGSFAGERLLLTTNLDAPNRRVVVADLEDPGTASWETVVPESESRVIRGASPVGGHYFVSYMEDAQPRLAQYDVEGDLVREIEFDVLGSVFGPSGEWDEDEAWITFTSFHVPTTSYRLDVQTGETELWFRTEIPIDTEAMEVSQVWYASEDGTRVPMFLVHEKGLELDGTNPTYLTGYGGFNLSRTPGFSAQAAAWVSLGGVYALPNLRGGGEFGEAWHEAGMLENKQNVFDDFIAAAEYLIEEGYTSSEHLAIAGGSNGGLLVGAAMTQRPELFEAVVCTYPLLDMVRYHRFLVARFWVPEYGSAEDPEQFEYIREYSPYHNVDPGTEYPATLFLSGDGDTRVDPLHARKMAALVQAAQGGDEPILLRYHTKAGHSGGQPVSEQIEQMVDTLSFLLWQVGGD